MLNGNAAPAGVDRRAKGEQQSCYFVDWSRLDVQVVLAVLQEQFRRGEQVAPGLSLSPQEKQLLWRRQNYELRPVAYSRHRHHGQPPCTVGTASKGELCGRSSFFKFPRQAFIALPPAMKNFLNCLWELLPTAVTPLLPQMTTCCNSLQFQVLLRLWLLPLAGRAYHRCPLPRRSNVVLLELEACLRLALVVMTPSLRANWGPMMAVGE